MNTLPQRLSEAIARHKNDPINWYPQWRWTDPATLETHVHENSRQLGFSAHSEMQVAALVNEDLRLAAQKSNKHYRRAGEGLIAMKERLKHGQWMKWLRENFHLSKQTAQVYMKLAREWDWVVKMGLENDTLEQIKREWAERERKPGTETKPTPPPPKQREITFQVDDDDQSIVDQGMEKMYTKDIRFFFMSLAKDFVSAEDN